MDVVVDSAYIRRGLEMLGLGVVGDVVGYWIDDAKVDSGNLKRASFGLVPGGGKPMTPMGPA